MDTINQTRMKMELLKELNNALNNGENYTDYLNRLLEIYSADESNNGIKPVTATSYLLLLLISQNYLEAINKCKLYTVIINQIIFLRIQFS